MKRYIALLRGINVSGQKWLPLADLRRALLHHGFSAVVTYIQSGNVVVRDAVRSALQIEVAMAQIILKEHK
jgi:uncharacterized protein (DUF1697 family)